MTFTDEARWAWAWNGRASAASVLSEAQAVKGANAGEALLRKCLAAEGEGFGRVVFFGDDDDRGWTIETGDILHRLGGRALMTYAVCDLAVKLMEEGRYDLMCDVRELAWCWTLPFWAVPADSFSPNAHSHRT